MITNKTVQQLAYVATNGGSLVVSAKNLTVENMTHIANNLKDHAHLRICESDALTSENMAHIARNGNVIFE